MWFMSLIMILLTMAVLLVLQRKRKRIIMSRYGMSAGGAADHKAPDQLNEDKKVKIDLLPSSHFVVTHILAIVGYYYILTTAKPLTIVWAFFLYAFMGAGVLVGIHRLWSHKSFKARLPLRILLMVMSTCSNSGLCSIAEWCRNHLIHHKYTDTDADPYSMKFGFWWAQIMWMASTKHPKFVEKVHEIDMSELMADPVIRFQEKFHWPLVFMFLGLIPTVVPWLLWSESLFMSLCIAMTAYIFVTHQTGFVNSFAHWHGMRPYDKDIRPVDNSWVTYLTSGEGYHNYHHVFPYDYSASEFGWQHNFNAATALIDFCEKIGQVYDKKVAPPTIIKSRKERSGQQECGKIGSALVDNAFGILVDTHLLWIPFIFRQIFNSYALVN